MGNRYQQMDITTATPESLVAKLFQGAIRHARNAREIGSEGSPADRGRSITKAVAIVGELRSSLDHERGGEIATNLERLYDFVIERLTEANLRRSGEPIDHALKVLDTLEEAFSELARRGERGAA